MDFSVAISGSHIWRCTQDILVVKVSSNSQFSLFWWKHFFQGFLILLHIHTHSQHWSSKLLWGAGARILNEGLIFQSHCNPKFFPIRRKIYSRSPWNAYFIFSLLPLPDDLYQAPPAYAVEWTANNVFGIYSNSISTIKTLDSFNITLCRFCYCLSKDRFLDLYKISFPPSTYFCNMLLPPQLELARKFQGPNCLCL